MSAEVASYLALTTSRIITASCGYILHTVLAKVHHHSYDVILLQAIFKMLVYE